MGHWAQMPDGGWPVCLLLVEDDAIVRMSIADVLRDGGFAVLEASDAETALSLDKAGAQMDLVITDLHMPDGMSGLRLAERLRDRHPNLPIMIITGDGEFPGLRKFGPVIEKPFTTDEVLSLVAKTLGTMR